MAVLALLLAGAGLPSGLAAIDGRIAAERARLVATEAPLVRLVGAAERLRRDPPSAERTRRLARLAAWLAVATPPAERRAQALRDDLDRLAATRAGLLLDALAGGRGGPAPRRPASPLAACASSPFRSPVEGRVVPQRLARRLSRGPGLMLVALPAAAVTAPAAGRIAYAGPFRRYRDVVIVDHGGGWTSLLTGLERLDVRTGARVAAGETLGLAGRAVPLVTVALSRRGQAVDALAAMRRCAGRPTAASPFPLRAGTPT